MNKKYDKTKIENLADEIIMAAKKDEQRRLDHNAEEIRKFERWVASGSLAQGGHHAR